MRTNVKQVFAGMSHSIMLMNDGTVKSFGDNALGQLGLGDNSTRGDVSEEMGDNLTAISL